MWYRNLLLLLLLASAPCSAQLRNAWKSFAVLNQNTAHWVRFLPDGSHAVIPAPGYLSHFTSEIGCLADTAGNLLLSAGLQGHIRNANGDLIPGTQSNSDSDALILPLHGSTHVGVFQVGSDCRYWEVDLAANGGAGALVHPAPVILRGSHSSGVTATPIPGTLDYWVIFDDVPLDSLFAFRFGPGGLDTVPVVSAPGLGKPVNTLNADPTFDHSGMVYAARRPGEVLLFTFDLTDGTASYIGALQGFCAGRPEFSPNGQFLYSRFIPSPNEQVIYQWDLSSWDIPTIQNSVQLVHSEPTEPNYPIPVTNLHTDPFGRIHVPMGSWGHWTTIMEPDLPGVACNVVQAYVSLPGGKIGVFGTNQCKRYHDSELDLSVADRGPVPVELDLWPNPTSGLLNLPAEPAWVRAQVYDLRGRSVLDRTGRQATLDVAALAPGAYTLMLRDPLGRAVARGTFVRE